ncbi:hypothetical protein J31TS6_40110 [Brevibacillus reuszeri]|nr:hypothetical protein J31TS6_40110 [Brevibacillus reuszeri]
MIWKPAYPITSSITDRVDATTFGTDIAVSEGGDLFFEDGDLGTVSGVESFKQQVRLGILDEPHPFLQHAIVTDIYKELSQEEFIQAAERLAVDLVSNSGYDELTKQTDGLGHVIEEVYSIEKDADFLQIELRATGVTGKLMIKIPLFHDSLSDNTQ